MTATAVWLWAGLAAGAGAQIPPSTRVAYATVASAMQLQANGDFDRAISVYTTAVGQLNAIVASPLDPVLAKSARDHIAYSVIQLAVLQRGRIDVEDYLLYGYSVEKQYLGYEIVRADELFAQRDFEDAFTIWRTFSVRVGGDHAAGRPRELFDALDSAARSDYGASAKLLKAMLAEPSAYGESEPLFLLGEVERAQHQDRRAVETFWRAVSERPEMVQFGLLGPQICAAGALAADPNGIGKVTAQP